MNSYNDIEKHLLQIINLSPGPVYVCKGEDLKVVYANEATLHVWGKDQTVIGKPFVEALPEVVDQPFPKLIRNVYLTGTPYHTEQDRADLPVGGVLQTYYFKFSYQPLKDDDGTIWGVLCIATDVTELVKARENALESEKRFRTISESTDILIAMSDESSNAMYFNKAWLEFTGRSIQSLLEYGWADLLHPDDRERFVSVYLSAFADKKAFASEFRIQRRDGVYRWMLCKAPPRLSADGDFLGYISSCIDITEQKQDELRKNDFIGMVSHELKTPLTSMKAYVQMLLAKARKQDDQFTARALEQADKQVRKMTTMINGFLNVSRLEAGKIHIHKQHFDMAELVKDVEEESVLTISSHKVTFAPVAETIVHADRDKIGQVINNLISNAVKYSASGSTILVACVTIQNTAEVSVKDEGPGISPENMEHIFDRYYRVQDNPANTVSGFGIGLYLSAEIIQRHNGTIWVESEVGKGSTFYFRVPVV